ncbi:MAG: hypothetical protein AB8U66_03325 [Rickettsiales endosymbiont of Dermacentor nuttalli]
MQNELLHQNYEIATYTDALSGYTDIVDLLLAKLDISEKGKGASSTYILL